MDSRPAADEIASLLEPIARQRIPGATDAHIANWCAAERGLSTETFLFDLQCDGDDGRPTTLKPLVFRRPPDVSLYPDYDLTRQVMVMNRLQSTPLKVPTVCWLDRDSVDLGTPYYVMEQLPTIGTASDFPSYHSQGLYFEATPEQRATMWWGCVQTIADVHALDWRSLRLEKLLVPRRGEQPLQQVVEYCDELLRWETAQPRQELVDAIAWLRANIYQPEHVVLCWGDSRLSNILYGPQYEVTAVLDWEIAYIGDHEADLAWLLFVDWACSEYEGVPRLAGTPPREETVARYEQMSGRAVQNLRYNEVLAAVEIGIPVSRLETRLRNQGLLTDDFDLIGFCVERIRQLLD
jgi:aminoglycoside phosphotransferase (APT) family kinase protein